LSKSILYADSLCELHGVQLYQCMIQHSACLNFRKECDKKLSTKEMLWLLAKLTGTDRTRHGIKTFALYADANWTLNKESKTRKFT